jgi:hypothetical protein
LQHNTSDDSVERSRRRLIEIRHLEPDVGQPGVGTPRRGDPEVIGVSVDTDDLT